MSISIVAVKAGHIPELGRICYEAFGTLQERHGVEKDFDSVETATMVVGMFASRPDIVGFAAMDGGRLMGSNFLQFSDPVAGVGPITIRPDAQSAGIGRALMLAVMREAERRGIRRVRLQQESINAASMSLYTKLGFDWRECCVLMRLAPAPQADPRVRPATKDDLPEIDRISRRHYHTTRAGEAAWMINAGIPGFILGSSAATGYYFPGLLGHGFAESGEDLAALAVQAARQAPPPFQRALAPLGEHALHRALLARGCRTIKMFNYMTTGEYERPRGAWIPSVGM